MPDINMQVFEEAKRNQLVTEVDIQTQVSLDDYQVQLSDIANPTQSQDNVVIDRHGEFLSHWNESLDFDTWIKMSMELAGKKLLMIHGNDGLSSESNGDDTFTFFDEFDGASLDSTKWDNNGVSVTPSNSEITITQTATKTKNIMTKDEFSAGDYEIRTKAKIGTGPEERIFLGFNSDINSGGITQPCIYEFTMDKLYSHYSTIYTAHNFNNNQYYDIIVRMSSDYKHYIEADGVSSTSTTALTSNDHHLFFGGTWVDFTIDRVFIRKYTAIEPTYTIGTPKNISTALKSLGRAG